MKKSELKEKLDTLKGEYKQHESVVLKIENIRDLLLFDAITDNTIQDLKSIKNFEEYLKNVTTLTSINPFLEPILSDLREIINKDTEQKGEKEAVHTVRSKAVIKMRKSGKTRVKVGIVVLSVIAFVALLCGILYLCGVLAEIGDVICNFLGIFDCVAGIIFFAYELYNDKLRETEINDGDYEYLKNYLTDAEICEPFACVYNIRTGDVNNITGNINCNIDINTGININKVKGAFKK